MSLVGGTAHAQSGARSLHAISTGGGASAVAPPTTALYTNPAHLAVGERDATVELRLLDVRTYAGGGLFQFDHYNQTLASGRSLSRAQVDRQLDAWFGDRPRRGATYTAFVPVAFAYRPRGAQWAIGGGVRVRGVSETSVSRGLVDLVLRGTGTNRTLPVNGRYTAFSSVDVTGAFSYTFSSISLSVGIAPRIIFGSGFADGTLRSTVEIEKEAVTHTFDYTARAAGPISAEVYDTFNVFGATFLADGATYEADVNGLGGGVDLGVTYEARPGLFLSMSVTDLGAVQWSGSPQTVTPVNNEFRFEGVELSLERLENEFDGAVFDYFEHQVDSLAQAAYRDVDRDRSTFSTRLPTAVHVNGTWTQGRYTLNGGATLGLRDEAGAISSSPAAYGGGEVRLGPVPLRVGVRVGGDNAVTVAGGIGLHVGGYRFDVGASVTPSTSTLGAGARYALGMSVATVRF